MKYDKEVLTINNILTALDNFDNKEEIINAIKQSLYDIETDWHNEEYLKQQLQAYKDKEDKLLKDITTMNDHIKEIRTTNEKLQTNAIHNKKVMDSVNWKIKRVKGYCNDNIYELTAFEGRKELEHILQILNEGENNE